jgi:hypothetical protein
LRLKNDLFGQKDSANQHNQIYADYQHGQHAQEYGQWICLIAEMLTGNLIKFSGRSQSIPQHLFVAQL